MSEEGKDNPPSPLAAEAQGRLDDEQGMRLSAKGSMCPEDIANLLDTCLADIEELRRKQDLMIQKQEGADSFRRGQLDCMSERIYQAEKDLRHAEERQHDAIEKASATFQKHACDVEQERQNLMCVIGQVNQNFEHISNEIAQHGFTLSALEQSIVQIQGTVSQSSVDTRNSVLGLGHDVAVLQREVQQQRQQSDDFQLLEHAIQVQQQQLKDLQANMTVMHDALMRHSEAEVRQNALAEGLADVASIVNDFQDQQSALIGQWSEMRGQVSRLSDAMAGALALQDGLQEVQQEFCGPKAALAASAGRSPPATLPQGEWLPLTSPSVGYRMTSMPSPSRREEIGDLTSPARPTRMSSQPVQRVDEFFFAPADPQPPSRGGDAVFHHPRVAWQDLPHRDRFESLAVGDLIDASHPAARAHGDEAPSFMFEVARQDLLPHEMARRSRSPERPRVPEPSAVPAPVMGWEGGDVTKRSL